MGKIIKKAAIMTMVLLMLVGAVGVLVGCRQGRTFDVDGWTLYRFRGSGAVNIVSANCESLVEDGVLHIPSRIGRHDIRGFGRPSAIFGVSDTYFLLNKSLKISRIVLAESLHVCGFFWGDIAWSESVSSNVRYVEFLCNTFERIFLFGGGGRVIYIIPDGSRETLYDKTGGFIETQIIYEKSEWLAKQN